MAKQVNQMMLVAAAAVGHSVRLELAMQPKQERSC